MENEVKAFSTNADAAFCLDLLVKNFREVAANIRKHNPPLEDIIRALEEGADEYEAQAMVCRLRDEL